MKNYKYKINIFPIIKNNSETRTFLNYLISSSFNIQ